jgi:cytochrome c biogenesis protein CcmG, thiol:disulfide interchange protein DsbE
MNRFLLPIAAFALLVVVLAIGVGRAPEKSTIKSVLIGRPAPAYVLPDLGAAAPFDTRQMAGRWYALNVWGTWCVECRAEHVALLAIQKQAEVPIVGLNWKDDDALATEWLARLGNPYAHVPLDREGRIAIDYGVYGAPETFLIDAAGNIVHKYVGALTEEIWENQFRSRLPAGVRKSPSGRVP